MVKKVERVEWVKTARPHDRKTERLQDKKNVLCTMDYGRWIMYDRRHATGDGKKEEVSGRTPVERVKRVEGVERV